MSPTLPELEQKVINCRLCPRLVQYRENVPKRASFQDEEYWRRPVPGFGDLDASLLIYGLAPSIHGGNRTGRVFTGDESGDFLFNALYQTGFANQPHAAHKEDGLRLINCYITAAVKCVPPHHRPLKSEFQNCASYFENEFFLLKKTKVFLALGGEAYRSLLSFIKRASNAKLEAPEFTHGISFEPKGWPKIYASYHPSPQNTYTKKLTMQMMIDLLEKIKSEIAQK